MADTTTKKPAQGEFASGEELPKAQSQVKDFLKKFLRRKTAVLGFVIIVAILILAVIGPMITPYDPNAYDYSAILAGPNAKHIWGTDEFGRDVFSRIIAPSARPSRPRCWEPPAASCSASWPASSGASWTRS